MNTWRSHYFWIALFCIVYCINHSRQMCSSRKLCNQSFEENQLKHVILSVQDVTLGFLLRAMILWWLQFPIQMLVALLLYVYARFYIEYIYRMWHSMQFIQSIYATFTDTSSETTATTATARFHSKFHDQIVLPLCCCCSFQWIFFSFLYHSHSFSNAIW